MNDSMPWGNPYTERTCSNCINHNSCWTSGSHIVYPPGFTLRRSWVNGGKDVVGYMKVIWGGICNEYHHPSPSIDNRFIEAERRRINELPQKEWED